MPRQWHYQSFFATKALTSAGSGSPAPATRRSKAAAGATATSAASKRVAAKPKAGGKAVAKAAGASGSTAAASRAAGRRPPAAAGAKVKAKASSSSSSSTSRSKQKPVAKAAGKARRGVAVGPTKSRAKPRPRPEKPTAADQAAAKAAKAARVRAKAKDEAAKAKAKEKRAKERERAKLQKEKQKQKEVARKAQAKEKAAAKEAARIRRCGGNGGKGRGSVLVLRATCRCMGGSGVLPACIAGAPVLCDVHRGRWQISRRRQIVLPAVAGSLRGCASLPAVGLGHWLCWDPPHLPPPAAAPHPPTPPALPGGARTCCRAPTAFTLYVKERYAAGRGDVPPTTFIKTVAADFKALPAEERRRLDEQAAVLKAEVAAKRAAAKATRRVSGYTLFAKDRFAETRAGLPAGTPAPAVMKQVAALWKGLTEADQKLWKDKAAAANADNAAAGKGTNAPGTGAAP